MTRGLGILILYAAFVVVCHSRICETHKISCISPPDEQLFSLFCAFVLDYYFCVLRRLIMLIMPGLVCFCTLGLIIILHGVVMCVALMLLKLLLSTRNTISHGQLIYSYCELWDVY